VVAADGARSALRSLCGLKLEGAAYEGRFVIADIRIDLPLPTERLAFFDPAWNPGNTVLMHREPHGLWRIDYQLPPGETPEEALQPASMKARIDAQLAAIGHAGLPWQMDWSSVYSARALTLPDYLHRRIAFVGDAAHLLPIFGVRGANTGLQDAQNLAWKLGLALRGLAGPALLPSYSAERVAAAREIIDEAGKSTRFMTPPTRGFRLLRDAVLSLSLTQDFVRPLYHWRTSRPHAYGRSVLNAPDDDNAQFSTGPAPGAPLPNVRLGDDAHLLDALCGDAAGHFTLLIQDEVPDADVMAAAQRWQQRGVPLQVVQLATRTMAPAGGVRRLLADPDGRVQQRLGLPAAGGAYLLRPDQHVCARWRSLTAERLDRALHQALGQP
jgi:3-(3-hydroxy-phenyl)propionate hydroxylase